MDTLSMGHPVFELGSMFNAFVAYSEDNHDNMLKFFGYDFETAVKSWTLALKKYLGTEDEGKCKEVEDKARVIGYTRLLRRYIRRSDEAGANEFVAHYKKQLTELIEKVDTLVF
jgi:hypothetical protein